MDNVKCCNVTPPISAKSNDQIHLSIHSDLRTQIQNNAKFRCWHTNL